jgi:hypothetical protein
MLSRPLPPIQTKTSNIERKNYSRFNDKRLQEVALYIQKHAPASLVGSCVNLVESV